MHCRLEFFFAEKYLRKWQETSMGKFLQKFIQTIITIDALKIFDCIFCDFEHLQIFAKNSITNKFQFTVTINSHTSMRRQATYQKFQPMLITEERHRSWHSFPVLFADKGRQYVSTVDSPVKCLLLMMRQQPRGSEVILYIVSQFGATWLPVAGATVNFIQP